MSQPENQADLARQLRQHLDSLRAAGVAFLPAAPLPPAERPAAPAADPNTVRPPVVVPPAPAPTMSASLFEAPPSPPVPAPTVAGEEDVDKRLHELKVLAERVCECQRCPQLASTRTQTVFGVGPLDPELCFVGEAPGRQEDEQGVPFVGDAGQLLTRIIAACGLSREEVFILNILKCRPPGNRTPTPEEAANCREYLDRQIELVRPKYMCALGATAANNLLGTNVPIGRLRGRFHEYHGIPVLCTYHPSYLLRSPEKKKDVWEDMKKLLARMGRPLPSK
jgi:uracil-DNA glycosylase family 4